MYRALLFSIVCVTLGAILLANAIALEENDGRFSVVLERVQARINASERAHYLMEVTNRLPLDDTYRIIFSDDINWNIMTLPLYHRLSGMPVVANSTIMSQIYLSPVKDLPPGTYRINVQVTSEQLGTTREGFLVVTYQPEPEGPKNYVPNVVAEVLVPPAIDPREIVLVQLNLKNKNLHNFSEIRISLTSKYLNKQVTTTLEPLETKTLTLPFTVDSFLEPQKDVVRVRVYDKNQTFDEVYVPYEIVTYAQLVEKSHTSTGEFLKSTITYVYANDANTPENYLIKEDTSFLRKFFTKTEPQGEVVRNSDGTHYYAWQVRLKPQESITVTISENYRFLFFVVVLTLIIIVLYILLQSPVGIVKSATVPQSTEGGISSIRVNLHLTNKSALPLHHVVVLDRVPQIAHIIRKDEVGSLAPTRIIEHKKKGSLIKWEVEKLEAHEERIMSYTIKSKLSVLGELGLPSSIVKFTLEGKEEKVFSNRIRVTS
ncbi:hypothetical protein COY95_00910 [Candidatus Woesearchaeota archaeon CG_4_10_14_0_8_um_filter_47_5]|nr:MAG: hypothetical protein COY95_00910 [Candidatus Woesearchaeota archaeon CG_4_10_14_0_8_um_filter_47_5]